MNAHIFDIVSDAFLGNSLVMNENMNPYIRPWSMYIGAYLSSIPMNMWSTSSSHTVNSGNRMKGRKVLFCFLVGLVPSPAAAAAVLDLLLAERADPEEARSVFSERPDAEEERVALDERSALFAVVRADLPSEERVAEEDAAAVDLPSSYLAASARVIPAALSAS